MDLSSEHREPPLKTTKIGRPYIYTCGRRAGEKRARDGNYTERHARRVKDASRVLPPSCSRCRDGPRFSGRARDSLERGTRSVTQFDRRPVDFDKRTDAILPESGSFTRFGSANRNSRRRSDIRPARDIARIC